MTCLITHMPYLGNNQMYKTWYIESLKDRCRHLFFKKKHLRDWELHTKIVVQLLLGNSNRHGNYMRRSSPLELWILLCCGCSGICISDWCPLLPTANGGVSRPWWLVTLHEGLSVIVATRLNLGEPRTNVFNAFWQQNLFSIWTRKWNPMCGIWEESCWV